MCDPFDQEDCPGSSEFHVIPVDLLFVAFFIPHAQSYELITRFFLHSFFFAPSLSPTFFFLPTTRGAFIWRAAKPPLVCRFNKIISYKKWNLTTTSLPTPAVEHIPLFFPMPRLEWPRINYYCSFTWQKRSRLFNRYETRRM